MTTRIVTATAMAVAFMFGLCVASARAELSAGVLHEIDDLLRFIDKSGCEFNRNGTWHDSKAALEHVRFKYAYLLGKDQVKTAEDFIEKAASRSSLPFGQPYTVKCDGNPPVPSGVWLGSELARFRAAEP
jgi:hypothetical protein